MDEKEKKSYEACAEIVKEALAGTTQAEQQALRLVAVGMQLARTMDTQTQKAPA